MIAITLLVFYALGVWVFHATGVRLLPVIAIVVVIVDQLLIRKYGRRG